MICGRYIISVADWGLSPKKLNKACAGLGVNLCSSQGSTGHLNHPESKLVPRSKFYQKWDKWFLPMSIPSVTLT